MTESFFCSKQQIAQIADSLNSGDREGAMRQMNVCTADLIKGSDYQKVIGGDLLKVLQGDPEATKRAESSFANLAQDERQLWQSMSSAASDKNPNGLCQLTIVEDKAQGPHAEINGAKCH